MKKLLSKLGIRAFSGTYIQNGLMFGMTYEYFDPEGNEDKHLSIWLGILVVTIHLK